MRIRRSLTHRVLMLIEGKIKKEKIIPWCGPLAFSHENNIQTSSYSIKRFFAYLTTEPIKKYSREL